MYGRWCLQVTKAKGGRRLWTLLIVDPNVQVFPVLLCLDTNVIAWGGNMSCKRTVEKIVDHEWHSHWSQGLVVVWSKSSHRGHNIWDSALGSAINKSSIYRQSGYNLDKWKSRNRYMDRELWQWMHQFDVESTSINQMHKTGKVVLLSVIVCEVFRPWIVLSPVATSSSMQLFECKFVIISSSYSPPSGSTSAGRGTRNSYSCIPSPSFRCSGNGSSSGRRPSADRSTRRQSLFDRWHCSMPMVGTWIGINQTPEEGNLTMDHEISSCCIGWFRVRFDKR